MAVFIALRILRRRALRRERVFRDRTNPIDLFNDEELFVRFRFRREHILFLTEAIEGEIEHANRLGALLPVQQVCLALRFYATGSFQDAVGELLHVSQSTASRTIHSVTKALLPLMPLWIKWPEQAVADKQKEKFFEIANFPQVFGCVDATHIPIQRPSKHANDFVNRRKFYSMNIQIICDADMMIFDLVALWPGSIDDARILWNSSAFQNMERPESERSVTGYILGDNDYFPRKWLLTPVVNPKTDADRAYNKSHSATISTVTQTFASLKKRWQCLKMLRLSPEKACGMISVCCMLYNRARSLGLPDPDSDVEENDSVVDGGGAYSSDEDLSDSEDELTSTAAGELERLRFIDTYF